MLVYFVTDEPTKLPAIRAMLEPQHAVVPWVLGGDGTGLRSHGVLMVDIDLRQMTRVDQLKFILQDLAVIPEKLFVVHNLSRSMVAQAYALGATAVISRPKEAILKVAQIEEAETAKEEDAAPPVVDMDEGVAVFASMFEQSHADGIILIGDMVGGDAALDALADRHPYIVGVTDRVSRRRVPGIYADNDLGTRLALDHLWSLGHRDVICVVDERMADGPFRAGVYQQYLRDRGASDRIRVYHVTQPDAAPAYRLGRELFAQFDRPGHPTAIFAASDTIAIGLLQAAFQHGIRVPEQLSIVGFDDVDAATYMVPPLTTVSQRGPEMGEMAAGLILDMIEKQRPIDEVDDIVVTPRLVVRQSTGLAPASVMGPSIPGRGPEVEER